MIPYHENNVYVLYRTIPSSTLYPGDVLHYHMTLQLLLWKPVQEESNSSGYGNEDQPGDPPRLNLGTRIHDNQIITYGMR